MVRPAVTGDTDAGGRVAIGVGRPSLPTVQLLGRYPGNMVEFDINTKQQREES